MEKIKDMVLAQGDGGLKLFQPSEQWKGNLIRQKKKLFSVFSSLCLETNLINKIQNF